MISVLILLPYPLYYCCPEITFYLMNQKFNFSSKWWILLVWQEFSSTIFQNTVTLLFYFMENLFTCCKYTKCFAISFIIKNEMCILSVFNFGQYLIQMPFLVCYISSIWSPLSSNLHLRGVPLSVIRMVLFTNVIIKPI